MAKTVGQLRSKVKSELGQALEEYETVNQEIRTKIKSSLNEAMEELSEVKKGLSSEIEEIKKQKKKATSTALLDTVQEKVISRKLLVFGAATALFVWSGLDADIWGMIAMTYVGGQSAIDFAKIWKS
jgi:hypothetical protein